MRSKYSAILLVFFLIMSFSPLKAQTQETDDSISSQVIMCKKICALPAPNESNWDASLKAKYHKIKAFCSQPLEAAVPTAEEIITVYEELTSKKRIYSGNLQQSILPPEDISQGTTAEFIPGTIFPEETIVAGITSFLINRAKDEIVDGFLRDIEKTMAKEENKHYRMLLPRTYDVLKMSSSLRLKTMIPTFKAAIEEDFKKFPQTLLPFLKYETMKYTKDDASRQKYNSFFEIAETAAGIAAVFYDLSRGESVLKVLGNLSHLKLSPPHLKLKESLFLLGVISKELNYLNVRHQLQLTAIFKYYLSDDNDIKMFSAILCATVPGLDKTKVSEILIANIKPVMQQLTAYIEMLDNARKNNIKISLLEHLQSINKIIGSALNQLTDKKPGEISHKLDKLLGQLINIQTAVKDKKYNLVIVYVIEIITDNMPDNPVLKRYVLPFLALIANLAKAGDSQAVVKAIEDFAAPVGSFQLKRSNENNKVATYLTINSYLGLSLGGENIKSENIGTGWKGSLFAPIGLEFGISTTWKPISSIAVFVSVIDVGTQLSYRLSRLTDEQGNDVSAAPNIGFSKVFAPGAFLVLGITQRHPISIGGGVQYVANLREIEATGQNVTAFRFFGFIAIDMTLFKF